MLNVHQQINLAFIEYSYARSMDNNLYTTKTFCDKLLKLLILLEQMKHRQHYSTQLNKLSRKKHI